jgi:hypothetical protein
MIRVDQHQNETYIYEFLLPLIICPTGLVLEDHVIIPSVPPVSKTLCGLFWCDTYLRLTWKSDLGFNKGLPRAMSCSRAASSTAAFSRSFRVFVSYAKHMAVLGKLVLTSCSLFSALSRLIFSNSRCSSAVSSSSSSLISYQHLSKSNLP